MSDTKTPSTTEPAEAPKKTTLSITVDGRAHEANPGQLVIDAAEDAGSYVPRFCYHPRMTPVGMCRQCFVEVEGPRGPMMVVSCMTPVAEGQVVVTDSPGVKKAQEGVLEFLLANHPLDCPVCDKGGECPLQDQAFSHGPGESRFVEEKRHYEKPIPISDLVYLDRERCILCDRCTRFADEVAGDPLIHFTHRGNNTQVQTFPDQPFSSYFSGNTVQICPVGALTAKPYRFKARPWDLDQQESTCTTCSVGCRTIVQSSRDEILRYQGVDSDAVNWGWLCDKGRFGFEAVNADDRLANPLVRVKGDKLVETTWSGALDAAAALLKQAVAGGGAPSIALIGGARGTNEDAYAWAALADAMGVANRDAQLGDGLAAEVVLGLPRATIADACSATTVVLLGPDLKEELPVLYIRLRDAAEKRKVRLLEISASDTGLTRYAWKSLRYVPGAQAQLVHSLLTAGEHHEIADQLAKGNVVVVAGRPSLAESDAFTIDAFGELRAGLPEAAFLPVLRRGNVLGALALGLTPAGGGKDTAQILAAAAAGKIDCLVLLGADPIADFPDKDLARRALAGARSIVAIDTFLTESSRLADVVLNAAAHGEKSGTTTNLEGRVSALSQKVTPRGTSRPDWMIAAELGARLGYDLGFDSLAAVTDEIAIDAVGFAGVTRAALAAARDGLLIEALVSDGPPTASTEVPPISGYGFRLSVGRKLYDQAIGTQHSASLASLAPGARLQLHPLDCDRLGVTAGHPVKVISARTSLALDVEPTAGVPRGVARVAFNQGDVAIAELISSDELVTDVRVETL